MSDRPTNTPYQAKSEFRNIGLSQITHYDLPLPAKISILHRLSGIALFLFLPWMLYLFEQSITSEISFETFKAIATTPLAKIILSGLMWAYLHHFFAGIRFLLLDVHVGVDKASARKSAGAVFLVSIPLAILCSLTLFGVFS